MMIAVRWAAARWRVKASATTPWRFGSTAAGEAASTSFGNKEEEDQEAWYASEEGGLSFRCTRCGRCCGLEGTRKVHVSDREIEEIARLLGEPETSVREDRVTRTETGHQVLRGKQRGTGEVCTFLHSDGTCTIHEAKPVQCRTYPYWPEFLASPFEWRAEGARCEGIGSVQGRVPRQEVRRQLVLETLSRSAREGGDENRLTYGESSDLLEDVGEDLLEEFERDFLARNRRQVVAENGDLVVVDFHGESEDGSARRVLISKQAPWLAQSEASIAPDGSVDLNRVPQRVQQALIASLALVAPREAASSRSSIAQIGAGACVAATALSLRLPDARVEAWDLDERALRLAADHFGAERGACVRLVRDAEEIVGESEVGSRAAILLDVCGVGGGRGEVGEIPPADPFLLPRFLEGAMAALEPGGVLAIHVANPNKEEALQAVASIARPRGLAVRSLALRGEGGVRSDPWLVYACPPHSPKTAEEFAKQLEDGPLRGLCPQITELLLSTPDSFWEVTG